jgi:hypothetical protein
VLLGVASGQDGFSAKDSGFASKGFGDHSPAHYNLCACLLVELVLTAIFLYVINGSTDVRAPAGFAGVAIGFTLMIIHLVSIPVSNTSVNPARSTGPAIIQHGWALRQLWLFWLAPILGALIAGASYRFIIGERMESPADATATAFPRTGDRPFAVRDQPSGGVNDEVRCMPAARPLPEITSAIFRDASSIISSPSIAEPFAPPASDV